MDSKTIDAVEMTRRIRDANYELLKNVSPEERLRYYREKAAAVHARIHEQALTTPSVPRKSA